MSDEISRQVSRRNDQLKDQRDFSGLGSFYRWRLQILGNLSGKKFGPGMSDVLEREGAQSLS